MSVSELDPVLVRPLERPEPRRRRRTPSGPRSIHARPEVMWVALLIAVGGILVAFAGHITTVALHPFIATSQTGAEIRVLEGELKAENAQNKRLRDDIIYLETKAGIEHEARRLGMVKEGEVSLTIVQPEAPLAPRTTAQSDRGPLVQTAAEPSSISGWIRQQVDTCLAVFGPRSKVQ